MHNNSYWCYDLGYGFKALAGKTDADNDYLTMKIASANDYWFPVTIKQAKKLKVTPKLP